MLTQKELTQEIIKNIEIERVGLGLTQKEMAEELDMSLSNYKKIINYQTDTISIYFMYKLYKMTGKLPFQFVREHDDEYLEILDRFFSLKNHIQSMRFIEHIVAFESQFINDNDGIEDYISVLIPMGNIKDGMIYDSCSIEKVNIGNYAQKLNTNITCGIKITSNNLRPVYNKGDILLICKQPPRDGDIGVFINKESNTVYIRKFHPGDICRLEPINDFGETFYVNSNDKAEMDKWIRFGYVVTKIRL